jgi:excisionase family DNA binding protein
MDRLLYRMNEAAEVLGISRSKAYELAAAGLMPGLLRFGASLRVSVRALEAWIKANQAAGLLTGQPAASVEEVRSEQSRVPREL